MVASASRPRRGIAMVPLVAGVVFIVVAYLITEFPLDAYCTNSSLLPSCGLTAGDYLVRTVLIVLGGLGLATGLGVLVSKTQATLRTGISGNGQIPVTSALFRTGLQKRPALVVLVSVGIATAALLALMLVPVSQQFSLRGVAIYDLQFSCPGIDTTRGTTVYFHWSAASPTSFFVVSCSLNQVVYSGNGSQGWGSFVSAGGVYEFGSGCPGPGPCYPADVSGSYTEPLLQL
jgi:hypothetical protein